MKDLIKKMLEANEESHQRYSKQNQILTLIPKDGYCDLRVAHAKVYADLKERHNIVHAAKIANRELEIITINYRWELHQKLEGKDGKIYAAHTLTWEIMKNANLFDHNALIRTKIIEELEYMKQASIKLEREAIVVLDNKNKKAEHPRLL